jgi:hypothetical protein
MKYCRFTNDECIFKDTDIDCKRCAWRVDTCIMCGEVIPEGRQVCINCEEKVKNGK